MIDFILSNSSICFSLILLILFSIKLSFSLLLRTAARSPSSSKNPADPAVEISSLTLCQSILHLNFSFSNFQILLMWDKSSLYLSPNVLSISLISSIGSSLSLHASAVQLLIFGVLTRERKTTLSKKPIQCKRKKGSQPRFRSRLPFCYAGSFSTCFS